MTESRDQRAKKHPALDWLAGRAGLSKSDESMNYECNESNPCKRLAATVERLKAENAEHQSVREEVRQPNAECEFEPASKRAAQADLQAVMDEISIRYSEELLRGPMPPASDWKGRLQWIRGSWVHYLARRLRQGGGLARLNPYIVDWTRVFSPIERMVWSDIRGEGVPLVPQFPAGSYFLDFADPIKRIAIECDGAAYHQDKARDQRRDANLVQMGWQIFRVTGRECSAPEMDWLRIYEMQASGRKNEATELVRRWISSSSAGVVFALGAIFYGRNSNGIPMDVIEDALFQHASGIA